MGGELQAPGMRKAICVEVRGAHSLGGRENHPKGFRLVVKEWNFCKTGRSGGRGTALNKVPKDKEQKRFLAIDDLSLLRSCR